MRPLLRGVVMLGLALFALGLSLAPLEAPGFTRTLAERYVLADEAGLSRERMIALAEEVRAFVVDGDESLPAEVDGRPAFDSAAVAHLEDVRDVLRAARVATAGLAALLAAWAAVSLARREGAEVARALRAAAVATVALPLLGAVAAVADFDAFFAAFHGLFFEGGTWVFPADSLLILVFPEPFWVACGIAWALLVASCSGLYGAAGRALRHAEAARVAGPSMNQPSAKG